jgi:hypothetical protein
VADVHLIEQVLTGAAFVLLVIAGRAVFVLFRPYIDPCPWCKNRGKCRHKHLCLIHRRRCWRCGNTRVARRIGAKQVHHVKLSLIQAWDEREWFR